MLKAGQKKHVCSYRFCMQCFTYHSGYCYIQPLLPKRPAPYRIAFFDFECTQTKQIITNKGRTKHVHEPNFIGLIVTCTECIKRGNWKNTISEQHPCKICGPHRTLSFAPFKFEETQVDKTHIFRITIITKKIMV
jgi:hypothetical protein